QRDDSGVPSSKTRQLESGTPAEIWMLPMSSPGCGGVDALLPQPTRTRTPTRPTLLLMPPHGFCRTTPSDELTRSGRGTSFLASARQFGRLMEGRGDHRKNT